MSGQRALRRDVDGVLLLDKPTGLTSNAALQRVKRLYAARKAGHTGTLDPLASGLLPICFGEATKFAQSMLDATKRYVATIRLGASTTTGDAEGDAVANGGFDFDRASVERALGRFVGTIEQVPPRHAALKFEGRAYYDYARKGIDIPRVARTVDIESLDLVDWSPPDATVRVACSKGTYVRVLAEDLGAALQTCAHLAALRRTGAGAFDIERAHTLAALESMDDATRDALLLAVDAPLATMPRLDVDAAEAVALVQGRTVSTVVAASARYRCYAPTRFLGVVDVIGDVARAVRLVQTT